MLDGLKKLEYHGGKDGLLFFLCDVIGHDGIGTWDAEVICSHIPGKLQLSVADLISYCLAFGWINVEADFICLSPSFAMFISDKNELNEKLIQSTINQLFEGEVFNPCLFSYDAVKRCYSFKNELLPLSLSTVRNVLISQGFLIVERAPYGATFYIAPSYDSMVAKYCKSKRRQLSIELLKKRLEENEFAGEEAELFVLSFEKARLGNLLCTGIKRISEIDASAGYDIVSFNSPSSQMPDRFIEVKAVSSDGFYWSKNEYEVAKLKGEEYYLYLVELSRIKEPGYAPCMIPNPATNVMISDSWFVEAQTYHIKRV